MFKIVCEYFVADSESISIKLEHVCYMLQIFIADLFRAVVIFCVILNIR